MKQSVDKIFFVGFLLNIFFKNRFLRNLSWKIFGVDVHREKFLNKVKEIIALRTREIENGSETQSNDVLSLMIRENFINNQLTEGEIYSNSLVLFIAGTDTSSNTLSWFFYEVGRRPDIQKRIREEIDRILPNGKAPTLEDYNSLIYLNACIMETLRCHPPVGSVFKEASKSTHLGPILIPKDSIVHSFIAYSNKNNQIWNNANIFDPERFMDEEYLKKTNSDYSMLPFSMGIRKCIGYKFSLVETCCVLARMLQSYEIELLNDEVNDPVGYVGQITFRPGNLKIRMTKRVQ
ncbi:predicted protein [Naegleria gruberi]|uniref:Predicted protein n=1 Tax=Naegleria gruberi TaxID=5762 RepID=D2VWE3_NAEGR|nr:uncharacterized protein NAEGRDRAFT_52794 [Naegleria gruberi]EFC38882.1 predicted protein [Naegleria gruberi]|eukprot:XP_002671626.1 predicted protein [Naegleria gruberi strain NEG-M]